MALLCALIGAQHARAFASASKLTPAAQHALAVLPAHQMIGVVVHLLDQRDLTGLQDPSGLSNLQRTTIAAQAPLRAWLAQREADGQASDVTPFWIFNGIVLSASREVVAELARRPDVDFIELNQTISAPPQVPGTLDSAPIADNLIAIGVEQAWQRGITGQGVVVAVLDSGVDMTHADLAARWRGGSNSWFDPYGEHRDEPLDVNGHGTQVLGVILGGDASGTRIGLAPDAQWIAARVFDDRDRATVAAIHQALQWVIDPDGDPSTPDAADVVNNSWSYANAGCNREFANDLRSLRAAGILPVFAAGLRDPISPADTPEAFAVGALAADNHAGADSPHGPAACGATGLFPSVVAPGEDIRTTDRFGTFTTVNGTSLAAAHVSGALALLLSASPTLSADEQEAILIASAVDLGEPGPDNVFGYGRIDVSAMIDRALRPVLNPWPFVLLAAALLAIVLVAGVRRRRARISVNARSHLHET